MKKQTRNSYIGILDAYLADHRSETRCNADSLLSTLYYCHHQQINPETHMIQERFRQLDNILSNLSLQQADQVVDITCTLCDEFQKTAFRDGILIGFQLYNELQEHPTNTVDHES